MASNNVEITEEELDLLSTASVVDEKTLKRRNSFLIKFKSYVDETSDETWENINKDKETLERHFISYLATFRVKKKGTDDLIRPKMLYFENILSHLKSALSTESGYDFTNKHTFPKLFKAVPQLKRKIKNEGRGNVKHTPPVPEETLKAIYDLLANVQALMTARLQEHKVQYDFVLEKIPEKYRDHSHDLLSLGEQFIVHLFDFRRGEEGIVNLPKNGWEKQEIEEKGKTFNAYIKVISEENKTHKDDVEDEDDFGIIPDITMENGFNPAIYHGQYLQTLNPNLNRLFQTIQRDGIKFDIHDFRRLCLFENSPRGINKIQNMLRILCKIVGKEALGNHSLRSTGICLLKENGFEDRLIQKFSRHKRITSLDSYNPKAKFSMKMDAARSLMLQAATKDPDVNHEVLNETQTLPMTPNVKDSKVRNETQIVIYDEKVSTVTIKSPKKQLLNLDPQIETAFDDDGGIDFSQIEYEESENNLKRKNDDKIVPMERKRPHLADITNLSKFPTAVDRKNNLDDQNQLEIFGDKKFMSNFFSDFNDNQQKTIHNNQVIMAREQNLRRHEQEIRQRDQNLRENDQDVMKKLIEQLCSTNQKLLERF